MIKAIVDIRSINWRIQMGNLIETIVERKREVNSMAKQSQM